MNLDLYQGLARQLRADSIRCSTAAGSGHPTSSLSAADLIAVLLGGHLRYDWAKPEDLANDHLIFRKGHASPLNYALFRAAGAITDDELMTATRTSASDSDSADHFLSSKVDDARRPRDAQI